MSVFGMKRVLTAFVACIAAAGIQAGALPGNLQFNEDGSFGIADFLARIRTVGDSWNRTAYNTEWKNPRFAVVNGSRVSTGDIPVGDGAAGEIRITPEGENQFRYRFEARIPQTQKILSLHLELRLPLALRKITIDGRPFELPENQEKTELFKYRHVKTLSIPLRDGSELVVRGNFRLMIQDSRQFGGRWFELRLAVDRDSSGARALDFEAEVFRDRSAPDQYFRSAYGQSETRVENEKWARLDFKRETASGSALDFSFLLDAPAGKYGPVVVGGKGNFEFADRPGIPVRFYGGNFSWRSALLDHETTDRVAAELVRLGYNWVRAHQSDTQMVPGNSTDSTAIDPEMFDRWDYFVYRMKESGIYFTTDLYSSRRFRSGDPGLEKYAMKYRVMKPLLPFSKEAMENWKAFARKLLTHVNPYTKLPLAEESALVCLNLVNEDGLAYVWDNPLTRDLYKEAFERYCADRGITGREMKSSDRVFLKFLDELQRKVLLEQIDFVKNELKVKCPVTSISAEPQVHWTIARSVFDLVDCHLYYCHPAWPNGREIYPQAQRSGLVGEDCASFVKCWMPSRLWEKPFVSTEFRYCWPSLYRSEQGPLIGAYGALQGYDGLCGYGYAEGDKGLYEVRHIVNSFETCNDPLALFSDKIAELLFLRGDVSPSRKRVAVRVPGNLLDREELPVDFPTAFRNLGLITGIGATVERRIPGIFDIELADCGNPDKLADPQLRKLWQTGERTGVFTSDTGEIRLDRGHSTLQVVTPRSEVFSFSNSGMKGKILEVEAAGIPTTVGIHSLDGQPLEACRSAVMFHLTETSNTGERYEDGSLLTRTSVGTLPLLVRRGAVKVVLDTAEPFRIVALNCDGKELGEVASTFEGNRQRFTLRTDGFPGGVMAYALKR